MSDARPEPPPRQRKGPARHTPGPINSKSVTSVFFTPEPSLLAMADSLVNDGIGMTPVRSKIAAAQIADRLRRQLPINEEDVAECASFGPLRRAAVDGTSASFSLKFDPVPSATWPRQTT